MRDDLFNEVIDFPLFPFETEITIKIERYDNFNIFYGIFLL